LVGKPSGPVQGANWKWVLGVLVGLPLLVALFLSRWMGTPREGFDSAYVFAEMNLPPVTTTSLQSLAYGNLLFARIEVAEQDRAAFLRSLSAFEVSRGRVDKPVSLKLEREWWNPTLDEEGTGWKQGPTSLWNPDSKPDLFFVVVQQVP
jgi:hypothetical protein